MKRRDFVLSSASTAALAPLLGLAGCSGGGSANPFVPPAGASKVGPLFAARLNSIKNFPDAQLFSLLQKTAASVPMPQQIEIALDMLGAYGASEPSQVPTAIPPAAPLSFPADHGEHFNTQIEWRYITLSLPLSNGGLVSVMGNFFRKQIVFAADSPASSPLDRQLYSTSMGVTIEMPGQPGVHYALPTITLAGVDGTVSVGNEPFHMSIGPNSLTGTTDVFPLRVQISDPGDPSAGRPAIAIDVVCEPTNPLFLQGLNGYVGTAEPSPPAVGWYYYSWPQQHTTGSVSISGTSYAVSNGTAWMDHQWGGSPVKTSGPISSWSGWCWFEFQFDGNRSLTLASPHGPITGPLPPNAFAFGTYVDNGHATLVLGTLTVNGYVASTQTTAHYPSAWSISMASLDHTTIVLSVTPNSPIQPQTVWMGQLTEYSEASCTATAVGTAAGVPVSMSGVGFCEGVGFEDPAQMSARQEAFLKAKLS